MYIGETSCKEPVKLMPRVKIAHSFFIVYKLTYVILHVAVKEFFETHF